MKRIALALLLLAPAWAGAQTERSAFTLAGKGVAAPFATDYQALGINPANLHFDPMFEGKNWALGTSEMGVSIFSEALTKEELRKNLTFQSLDELSPQERKDAIAQFTDSRWTADLDFMHFGMAYRNDVVGGFAFSARERLNLDMKLGPEAADLMFNGYNSDYFDELVLSTGDTIPTGNYSQDTLDLVVNGIVDPENIQSISQLLNGTDISVNWVREYNLGYGRRVLNTDDLDVYAGVGLKYLQGMANISIRAEDGTINGLSATSPFLNIDYGEAEASNPSAISEEGLVPVGRGFGVDLGASVVVADKFTISAALNDIGGMTWTGNVYQLKDTVLTETFEDGVETVSLVDQLAQFMTNEDLLEWEGEQEYTTKLPTTFRLGAGLALGERIRVGAELVAPLNDDPTNIDRAVLAVGGDVRPVRWMSLNMGFISGGNYNTKIPAGVTFHFGDGSYEVGVASRDMITFFTDNQPTASLSAGFLRFRW